MNNSLGQLPFPTKLAFEPIQLCNAACLCCPYTWLRNDEKYLGVAMSRDQIKSLLDDFGGVRRRHGYTGILKVNPFRFSDPLVCKDLDLIFDLAEKHDAIVVITTNGVHLSGKNLEILNRYRHRMMKLSVSFIGSTATEIRELMGLNVETVLRNLDEIAENWPKLRPLVRVTLRVVKDTREEHEALGSLQKRFEKKGISVKGIRENWMTNRVNVIKFEKGRMPDRQKPLLQSQSHFVNGCGWAANLLERIEVMVDGEVVLCCEDAEKHKCFGNVFEEGIESIWMNMLRREHFTIMNNEFSPQKESLICATCSRAVWSDGSVINRDMLHHSATKSEACGQTQAFYLRNENMRLQQAIHNLSVKIRESKN
ncbi:MAG: SPASM domain-containing protein [Nitrospira sp.]|nr:SPASM domain-containing protein [Nitrospira sp.]